MRGNNVNWQWINLSSCVPVFGLYPAVIGSWSIYQKNYCPYTTKLFYVESGEAFLQNISMSLALVPLYFGIYYHGLYACTASGAISTAMVTAAFAAPALGALFAILELYAAVRWRIIIPNRNQLDHEIDLIKKMKWRSNIHFLTSGLHIAGSVGALLLLLGVGACATASTGGAALPIVALMLSVFAPQLIKYISLQILDYKYQIKKSEEDGSSRCSSAPLLRSSHSSEPEDVGQLNRARPSIHS